MGLKEVDIPGQNCENEGRTEVVASKSVDDGKNVPKSESKSNNNLFTTGASKDVLAEKRRELDKDSIWRWLRRNSGQDF